MPVITVRSSGGPPVTYRFDQGTIRIGRSASSDLVVRDPMLSRFHAELRLTDTGWVVSDRGSSNGTELNGRRIDRDEPLSDGDEIALGGTVLEFASSGDGSTEAEAVRETDRLTWSAGRRDAEGPPELIGKSAAMRALFETVDRVAAAPGTVLITGENGTGKELVARRIHHRSSRRDGPFVVVNCPAVPGTLLETELFGVEKGVATGVEPRPGLFAVARGGTLLLDEIGDLDAAAQAKILRVLQDKTILPVGARSPVEVDVRIVAATHHDLESDVEAGGFRRDLYHRLHVFSLTVPPLRDRREDIPLLVEHFLSTADGPAVGIDPDALDLLTRYDFPGNVRELEHAVERARFTVAAGSRISIADLPEAVRRDATGEGAPGASAGALYERIVEGGESFWDVVHGPFLKREVSREDVRALVARAHEAAGGSYKEMARLFGIESDYKKLLNFLRNHDLGVPK